MTRDFVDLPRPADPRVSVLVPVRGGAPALALLRDCLRQLARCAGEASFETLLLLNEVPDEVRGWIERSVPGARIRSSPVNLGLAGGLRLLRSDARGELLVSIHQDTVVEPGWLAALVAAAEARPDAGAIGSLVLDPDAVTAQAAGWVLADDGITFPPWWGGPVPTRSDYEGMPAHGVDYAPSSSLLLRADVWDAFGGPDERLYPGFYVDVDLAMGVRSVGRSVLVEPRAVARHHRGSATTPRFRRFVSQRNRRLFLAKWAHLLDCFLPSAELDAGVAAAVERAAEEAERCRIAWSRANGIPVGARTPAAGPPAPMEPRELERRCAEHERAVRAEYLAFLEQRLAELESELALRPAAVDPAAAAHQPP